MTLPEPVNVSLYNFARAFRFGAHPIFNFRTLPPKLKNLAARTDEEKEHFKKAKKPYEAWLQLRCEPYGVDAYSRNRDLALDLLQDEKKRETLKEIRRANREADASAVFFVVNAGGQKKADIKQFTAFYGEWDDIPLEEQWTRVMALPIPPHVVIKARASLHFYWLADEETTAEEWLTVQRTLIVMCGSDMAICDLPRVMRVPGYDHTTLDFETGEVSRVPVTCLKFDTDERLSSRAMLEMLEMVGQAPVSKDGWNDYAKARRAKSRKAAGLGDVEKAPPIWQGEAPADLKARFEAMLESLEVWGPYEDGFRSTCPSCHDPNPSLVSTLAGDRIFHHDFAGCTFEQICDGGGWAQGDCFAKKKGEKKTTQNGDTADDGESAYDHSYRVNGAGLIYLKRVMDRGANEWRDIPVQITNFTATIKSDVSRDDGAEQVRVFEVEACLANNGGPHRGKVLATDFGSLRWADEILGARATVFPGKREYAAVAIRLLSENIETRRVIAHTGWRFDDGNPLYYRSGGAIGADGLVEAEVELPAELAHCNLPAPPDGARLKEVVRAVAFDLAKVAPETITLPLIGSGIAALIPRPDFAPFLMGETGWGKSEVAALIQALFGSGFNAKTLPDSWISSANSLEIKAHTAKDCVFTVDDFNPTGSTHEQLRMHAAADRLLRANANQSGRGRARADGGLRATKAPRGLILSTGEDLPRGQSLRARLAVIQFEKDSVNWAQLTSCQKAAREGVYAEATSAFIQWLAKDNRVATLQKESAEKIGELRDKWLSGGIDAHKKSATTLAYIQRAWDTWLKFAADAGALTDEECAGLREAVHASLDALGRAQERYLTGENPSVRFFDLLQSAIVSGKAHLAGTDDDRPNNCEAWGWRAEGPENEFRPLGDRVGWVEGANVYLHPDTAYKVAQAQGANGEGLTVTAKTLWKRLDSAGALLTSSSDRNTIKKQIGEKRLNVLHFSAEKFGVLATRAADSRTPPAPGQEEEEPCPF